MKVLFSIDNLGQGYNTAVNPYMNKKGECREALNADFSEIGSLGRFPGYETYGSDMGTSAVSGLYDCKNISGGTVFIAVHNQTIFYLSGGTWTASNITNLTANKQAYLASHLDTFILVNGFDAPKKSSDGQTWSSLGGSPPTAKYVLTFDNKVYMLNVSGHTSRMQWSSDGTTETWTPASDNTAGFQDVATNIGVGDEITGGAVNNNSLIVFKNYSTWKWDTFSLVTLNTNVGCRAPRSIATIDDKTFFLSHKGVMMTDGGKPIRISKQISDFINGISDLTACVGWSYDNYYYLYIGTSNGVTNCLLIYDYDLNVWSYKSMNDVVKVGAVLTSGDSSSQYGYFGNDNGQVYRFKTGNTDNGTAIPFKWKSAVETCNAPHLEKEFHRISIRLESVAKPGIDVFYSVNFKDFKPLGTVWKSVHELWFPKGTKGQNIRLMFSSNSSADQPNILGYTCMGEYMIGKLGDVE